MTTKRMGRPPALNPKNQKVQAVVTVAEKERLQKIAVKRKVTLSMLIREAIMQLFFKQKQSAKE